MSGVALLTTGQESRASRLTERVSDKERIEAGAQGTLRSVENTGRKGEVRSL